MTRLLNFFLLTSLLVLSACGGSPEDNLQGDWVFDVDAYKESDAYKNAPDAAKPMMLDAVKNFTVKIEGDKITTKRVMGGVTKEDTETFKITKTDGNTLTVETESEGKTNTGEVTIDGDKMTMKAGKHVMTMKRK